MAAGGQGPCPPGMQDASPEFTDAQSRAGAQRLDRRGHTHARVTSMVCVEPGRASRRGGTLTCTYRNVQGDPEPSGCEGSSCRWPTAVLGGSGLQYTWTHLTLATQPTLLCHSCRGPRAADQHQPLILFTRSHQALLRVCPSLTLPSQMRRPCPLTVVDPGDLVMPESFTVSTPFYD